MSRTLLRKTRRDLMSRKGSLLALLAIVTIGVGSYLGMSAVYRDLDGARHRYYTEYRLADFQVDLKRAPEFEVERIQALPNVDEVRGRVSMSVLLDLPDVEEPISGTAISMPEERSPVLNDLFLSSGSWFSGTDRREVILNDSFAKANGIQPGDRIQALLLDKQHDLLVVGTAISPEFVYLIPPSGGIAPDPARFGVLYLPQEFLQESCDQEGAFNQLIGTTHDQSVAAIESTLDEIERELDVYGVANTTRVRENASVRFLADELHGLRVNARVIPAIFLGVAALIMNVLLGRMVAQQRSVIGTLKAIGYGNMAITLHYLGYGIFIGLLDGVFGIAFGTWIQIAMLDLYREFYTVPNIRPHFFLDLWLLGLAISLVFAMFGTIRGIRYAVRLEPAEAMHPPPPEKGSKILLEKIPPLWNPLPFRWKMILRAVFRNPFRSAVTVFACVISTGLILTTLANTDALDYLIEYEFAKTSHEDLTVNLRDPEGLEASRELSLLPGVAEVEQQLAVSCDLQNGPYEKRLGILGLVPNNRLITPLDANDQPIPIPEEGLVLSKKVAEILNVGVGDTLTVRALIGQREEVTAPVVATVESYLGLSAYARIDYLSRLIGEEYSANVLLAKLQPGRRTIPLFEELKERPSVIGVGERSRAFSQIDATFGETMGTMIVFTVFLSGLIAFGSILNTALVSLSEREREVGTLRVLGYTPYQVLQVFSGESFLLNAIGIVFGFAAGVALVNLIATFYSTELFRFPVVVYFSRILETGAIMIVIVVLAQTLVFRLIKKLKWLEVLQVKE
ncbi:MAG: FtsX-like permease family protein [Candidatus Omnitrophica bacterium]|nr:FtsX-like permease family protein [Candidatus Omnitrophota bacterium]